MFEEQKNWHLLCNAPGLDCEVDVMNELLYATLPNGQTYHLIAARGAYALCGVLIKPGSSRTRLEIPVPVPAHAPAKTLCKDCQKKYQENQSGVESYSVHD